MKQPDNPSTARDYLAVYEEITRLTSMVHDPQLVMELVVERLPELLAVDAATIRLLDKNSGTFVLKATWGVSDEYLARTTIDSQEVMAALRQGVPKATTDLEAALDPESLAIIRREGVKSVMSVPILFKQQVIGVLRLLSRNKRSFVESEVAFVMSLAAQLGIALTNSRLFQEMEHQVHFLRELRAISRLVNSTLDLEEIIRAIVEKLPGVMGVKGCTIRLLLPATNRLQLMASSGVSQAYLDRGSIKGEDSIFKVLKGQPVAIYDATTDPRVDFHQAIRDEGIKSILAVPITDGTEVIGVLRLLTKEHRSFGESEIDFAVAVAEEGGNAIQKARTYRKITLLFNQIEEQERFLSNILDCIRPQLLVIDRNRRVVMANRAFLQADGRKEEEVLGIDYSRLCTAGEDGEPCPVDQVLHSKRMASIYQQVDREGISRWYERTATPMLNAAGELEFVIEVIRDITAQRRLEAEQARRGKLEGVVELAGTVAHEINSPLFAALGTAQLLETDVTDPDQVADIQTIIRNLKSIGELTAKMTAMTGYTSREYVGETRIINL
jgi:two-component system, NtrC family, sensor kinase